MEHLKAGQRIGEYTLEEPLGEGGGGSVWRAKHAFIPGRRVAIKFPRDGTVVSWLRREGLVQAKLDHANVVRVFGGNLEGETPYIVLELVDGGDLRDALSGGPIPTYRVRIIARGILSALEAAHAAGVVHGDLKPENVLLTKNGDVKLTDFGLAHNVLSGELQHSMAISEQQVSGTLRYMPPELLEQGTPSARTDLYSFGVLLFELLVGRVPQGLECPADHDVDAPDLDRLFQACYVPESRRVESCTAALKLLEGGQSAPRGRLIQPRARPRPAPAPAPTPAPAPRPARRPPPPPSTNQGDLRQWRDLLVSVACKKTERGQWVWDDLPSYLANPRGEILAIDLSGDQIDDGDLRLVGGIRSLQSLDLSDNLRVTDDGLRHLSALGGLTYMSLRSCREITDAGLAHLRQLRRLSSLDLTGCYRVSDAGLKHLYGLGQLKFLFLDGCQRVTAEGVDALKLNAPLQWVSFGS